MRSRTWIVAAVLTLPWVVGAQTARATVLYSDGFESWAVGAYPSPPWLNMFSGASAFVSDAQARSGSQSFRSESNPWWARWDYVPIAPIPDYVEYRGAVRVETAGRGCLLGFGYQEPGVSGTGWAGNSVAFYIDGVLVGHDLPTEPKVLTYYGVPVPLDKFGLFGNNFDGGGTGVQYLDDVSLLGSDVPVATQDCTWESVKRLYR